MGTSVRCDVNDFYSTLMEMCQEHVTRTEDQLDADVRKAGRLTRDKLRDRRGEYVLGNLSPVGHSSGAYAKGWTDYHYRPVDGHVKVTVANASRPSLTHLLENGHMLFIFGRPTGRRTKGDKHIAKAYEAGAAYLRGLKSG